MIQSAKCRCGQWLTVAVDRLGRAIEWCRCGYASFLRGRTVPSEPVIAFEPSEFEAERGTLPCAWPAGCDRFAARRTDLCRDHCTERRRMKNRAYANTRGLELRRLRHALEGVR